MKMKVTLWVLVGVLALVGGAVAEHHCIHDDLAREQMDHEAEHGEVEHSHADYNEEHFKAEHGAKIDDEDGSDAAFLSLNVKSNNVWKPIRIKFDYTYLTKTDSLTCDTAGDKLTLRKGEHTCQTSDVLTEEKRKFIKEKLVAEAGKWISEALSVRPVTGKLKLNTYKNKCGPTGVEAVPVADSYRSIGVTGYDYVMFVAGRPTQGSTVAWAISCGRDRNDRPVAGMINFGPNRIRPTTNWEEQVGVAIHEIAHALGFSSSYWGRFRKSDGTTKIPIDKVRKEYTERGHKVFKLISSTSVKAVKEHFRCDKMTNPGLELEDGGGSGTVGSHLEKRLFRNEAMTGTTSSNPVLSPLFLAVLQDTGYYGVNYEKSEYLSWGNGGGCKMLEKKCKEWNNQFYCTKAHETKCTHDRTAKGYCSLSTFTGELPAHFQYFTDKKKGGGDKYADYCPYVSAYSSSVCADVSHKKQYDVPHGVEHGANSLCFESSLLSKGYIFRNEAPKPNCYKHECKKEGIYTRLYIQVAGSGSLKCPYRGGNVKSSKHNGHLVCPPTPEICGVSKTFNDPNVPDVRAAELPVPSEEPTPAPVSDDLPAGRSCNGGRGRCAVRTKCKHSYWRGHCPGSTYCCKPNPASLLLLQEEAAIDLESEMSAVPEQKQSVSVVVPTFRIVRKATKIGAIPLRDLFTKLACGICFQGRGDCRRVGKRAKCLCRPGYGGTGCAQQYCPKFCSGHGRCLHGGKCKCDDGWTGEDCSNTGVTHCGPCLNGHCTHSGACKCKPGWTSQYCDERLPTVPLKEHKVIEQTIPAGGWRFYRFAASSPKVALAIGVKAVEGQNFDIFVSKHHPYPSRAHYTWSATQVGHLEKLVIDHNDANGGPGIYNVGVHSTGKGGKLGIVLETKCRQDKCTTNAPCLTGCNGRGICDVDGDCLCSRGTGAKCENVSDATKKMTADLRKAWIEKHKFIYSAPETRYAGQKPKGLHVRGATAHS